MPIWLAWVLIAWHINSAPANFAGPQDFRLLLPWEYGFNGRGACVEYVERPSVEQVLYSIKVVETATYADGVILYEDGSCENVND